MTGLSSGTPATNSYLALNASNQLVKVASGVAQSATSSSSTFYPLFSSTNTSGTLSTAYVDSSGNFTFVPSTETLNAPNIVSNGANGITIANANALLSLQNAYPTATTAMSLGITNTANSPFTGLAANDSYIQIINGNLVEQVPTGFGFKYYVSTTNVLQLNSSSATFGVPLNGITLGVTGGSTMYVATSTPPISTGTDNVFVGNGTGQGTTSGSFNSFLGYDAGQSNTTGSSNTLIGFYAGQANTSGLANTCVGVQTGQLITSGQANTLIGAQAGRSQTTANYNVIVGYNAGYNCTASNNVYVGYNSGYNSISGTNNICLGGSTQTSSTANNADTNCIVIGASLNGNGSNTTTIGNSSNTDIYLNASGSVHCSASLIVNNNLTFNTTQGIYLAAGINWYVGGSQVGYFDSGSGSQWRISATNATTLLLNAPTTVELQVGGTSRLITSSSTIQNNTGTYLINYTTALSSLAVYTSWNLNCSAAGTTFGGFNWQKNNNGSVYTILATNLTTATNQTIQWIVPTTGNAGNFYPGSDNGWSLGVGSARWTAVYAVNGTIQTSDATKKIIKPLTYGIEDVMKMKPIQFSWKDDATNEQYYGFCAQDLHDVFPELVYTPVTEDSHPEGSPANGTSDWQVNYSEIIPICVSAIQQQNALIQTQATTISTLQAQVATLQTQLAQLMSHVSDLTTAFNNLNKTTAS
jgi:hypothetical protein